MSPKIEVVSGLPITLPFLRGKLGLGTSFPRPNQIRPDSAGFVPAACSYLRANSRPDLRINMEYDPAKRHFTSSVQDSSFNYNDTAVNNSTRAVSGLTEIVMGFLQLDALKSLAFSAAVNAGVLSINIHGNQPISLIATLDHLKDGSDSFNLAIILDQMNNNDLNHGVLALQPVEDIIKTIVTRPHALLLGNQGAEISGHSTFFWSTHVKEAREAVIEYLNTIRTNDPSFQSATLPNFINGVFSQKLINQKQISLGQEYFALKFIQLVTLD
ncbi:MAG: hypothetical protein PHH14_03600 [Candidatus Margulisbacteria bacterium]|nr:hypothetical protein [Candidatus Margulisiibacteriota bacterium]